jgi:hypothetical protein
MTAFPGTFTSTALAVKQSLAEALQAMTVPGGDLDGVQVTYGWPGKDPERQWLFLGKIHWISEDWAAQGARHRQEDYEIDLVINIVGFGSQDEDVEVIAFQYLGAVENYLRLNPFQPATAQSTAVDVVPTSSATFPTPDGAACELAAKVRVSARI